eukprot:2428015-Amphidinium_carterae.1
MSSISSISQSTHVLWDCEATLVVETPCPPLALAMGTALSGFWLQHLGVDDMVPSVRMGSNMDFLRAAPGQRVCAYILDDCDLNKVPMEGIKSFHDLSCESALVWARWGAVFMERHQP